MGRPKVEEPKKQYTVMLRPSVVAEIDRLAAIRGRRTRSELMSNLIDLGLEELQTLDKLGLLNAVAYGDRVLKKLKDAIRKGKIVEDEKGNLEIKK